MSVHTFEEIRDEAERQGKVIDEQKKAEAKKPKPRKKKTAVEIMNEDMEQMDADVKSMIEEARPKTPLEAAIDHATGFKPEDAVKAIVGTDSADSETEQGDSETKPADSETEQGDSETKPAEDETPAKKPAKRDWVEEAYKCFIKDAGDIDPTDPISAIAHYFAKNATPELKARCEKEGKNATGCWKFIEAVARKALHGSSGHIDPAVVYAIAMHWFEDVPKDWNAASAKAPARQASKKPTTRKERLEERVSHGSRKAKAELRELKKKERAKAAKAKKPKNRQGFFFEMLEAPATAPEAAASGTKQESEVQG